MSSSEAGFQRDRLKLGECPHVECQKPIWAIVERVRGMVTDACIEGHNCKRSADTDELR